MTEDKREHMPVTVELLKRLPVESSALRSIGYDAETRVMDVEFAPPKGETEGAVWRYDAVPPEDVEALVGAESIGKAWGAIKTMLVGRQVAGPLPKKRRGAE